jgi:uncharacterized protein YciI
MPTITHYLYKLQPARLGMLSEGPTETEAAITAEHFAYLEALVERGVVVLAGRTLTTDASSFGICILRAASEAEARTIMENDPGVRNGVMRAELFPYRIALIGRPDQED